MNSLFPTRNLFTKSISLLISITFLFSNIAFAEISAPDIVTSQDNTQKEQTIVTDPEKIVIPRDFGLVKSTYTGKENKLVINIQDAHCNYEAQTNITKILENLVKFDGLNLISVEGADGFIDTSWFKSFPDAEIRKEVADYFMKKGEITGPEFLSITTDLPIKLFGAETRAYYIENLNAFTSSYALKDETEKYFKQIKGIINKIKSYVYSTELRDLDLKKQDYESKKLQFSDYVKYLQALAESHRINLRQYDHLFKLVSVLVYEKKINFSVVDKERGSLIDELTKKLDKDAMTELVTKSLSFKTGKISSVEYYAYLKNVAQANGYRLMDDYPNLFNYIIYNSVYARIENEKLFDDIKKLELAIKEKLFANDDQRTLSRLSDHIDILIGLVNIKLLNGDFDYFKTHKDEFTHGTFATFINKMAVKYGLAFEMSEPTEAVSKSIAKLEDFYSIAIKRDRALVDNTLEAMNKENRQICVLVTGGFHSEGIAKMLESKGISYMVVCPNITKEVETPYIKVLTNQRTPLEDILTDTGVDAKAARSMLAPYSAAEVIADAVRFNNDENRLEEFYSEFQSVKDRSVADRGIDLMADWTREYIEEWIRRAEEFAGNSGYSRKKSVMYQAFMISMPRDMKDLTGNSIEEDAELIGQIFDAIYDGRQGVDDSTRPGAPGTGGVGAIRGTGGMLSAEEHRGNEELVTGFVGEASVNSIINRLIGEKRAFMVVNEGVMLEGDIPLFTIFNEELKGSGVNVVVITGLTAALVDNNVAPDLLLHPGINRKSVYIDEQDYNYLLSLADDGIELIKEAIEHEKAHMENPDLPESAIEAKASSANVREALTDLRPVRFNVEYAASALGIDEKAVREEMVSNINRVQLLNDFAETVGIDKLVALENMIKAGMVEESSITRLGGKITVYEDYKLTDDFVADAALNKFIGFQKDFYRDRPDVMALIYLMPLRLERIMLDSIDPVKFIDGIAERANITDNEAVRKLEMARAFPLHTTKWHEIKVEEERTGPSVTLKTDARDIISPNATSFYDVNGVAVDMSMPEGTEVNEAMLNAKKRYQDAQTANLRMGGFNYRGVGTDTTVKSFFDDYFKPNFYGAINNKVDELFTKRGQPLKAIVTNGIGANDMFMWSLADMYNAKRDPRTHPEWIHVATARDLAKLTKRGYKGDNTLFIDISRSGGTFEGVEVAIRSLDMGYTKRIAIANGGKVIEIANRAAEMGGYEALAIPIAPDIGGRNMHRKTPIFYTALTVAGKYVPEMDSTVFAEANHKYDVANAFDKPDKSLAVACGKFLDASMYLNDVEHIAVITNSEPLRLIGTEWEQYIMEGCNKKDVISMGIHDLKDKYEDPYILENAANGPAGKKMVAMAILDKSSVDYIKEKARVEALRQKMPLMIFEIESGNPDGKINPEIQAAFDILWTDFVTVFTTLLRIDANSNPNVKDVRKDTKTRVDKAQEMQEAYEKDLIGQGQADVLVSVGMPREGLEGIGGDAEGRERYVREKIDEQNAAIKGQEMAKALAADGMLSGRSRMNLFVGRDDLMDVVKDLRRQTYKNDLLSRFGWITQTALFPLWSHKGLEANLSKPLADKTVNFFLNSRRLGENYKDVERPFNANGIEGYEKLEGDDSGKKGASLEATNDAMTMPNVMNMAKVSPTILFEFNDRQPNSVEERIIREFFKGFTEQLAKEEAGKPTPPEPTKPVGRRDPSQIAAEMRFEAMMRAAGTASDMPPARAVRAASEAGAQTVSTDNLAEFADFEVMGKYAVTLDATRTAVKADKDLQNKHVVIATDLGIVDQAPAGSNAELAIQISQQLIEQNLGEYVKTFKGRGAELADQISAHVQSLRERGIAEDDIVVVSIAGSDTLDQISEAGRESALGKILQISKGEGYVPVAGLHDLALRVAYNEKSDDIFRFLQAIAQHDITMDMVENFLLNGGRLPLKPIVAVDPNEIRDAYLAAVKALTSL